MTLRRRSSVGILFLTFVTCGAAMLGCSTEAIAPTSAPQSVTPSVYINEILAHTDLPQIDAVELFNPASTALDISGWYLSDKKSDLRRVQLPAGLVVPANGYLVIDENVMRAGDDGFGLSESGESVYLSWGDEVIAQAKFDASPNGVSFGRIQSDYVLLTHPTLGHPNAPPQIGPIIIQEIYAGSSPTLTQYILFENITNETIPLYDPQNPDNVWHIRKTVDFDFPSYTTIAPHEQFIVAADPPALAAQTGLRIFGPFADQLSPTGSTIELQRPDTPNDDKVPYIIIDYIDFANISFWHEPMQSLPFQRISSNKYGNDSTNWELASP